MAMIPSLYDSSGSLRCRLDPQEGPFTDHRQFAGDGSLRGQCIATGGGGDLYANGAWLCLGPLRSNVCPPLPSTEVT